MRDEKKRTITKIQLWKKTKDEVRNEGYLERESWRTGQRRSQRLKDVRGYREIPCVLHLLKNTRKGVIYIYLFGMIFFFFFVRLLIKV